MTTLVDHFPNIEGYASSDLAKATGHGEGSRGGRIIGHTKSGKAVYAAGSGRYHHLRAGSGKQHKDPDQVNIRDSRITMGHYPGFTAQDHDDAGDLHEDPNHHTAAGVHFLAAMRLAKIDAPKDQSSFNDTFGSLTHQKFKVPSAGLSAPGAASTSVAAKPAKVIGTTKRGHAIYSAKSPAYRQFHDDEDIDISDFEDSMPHLDENEHEEAAGFHNSHAAKLEAKGKMGAARLARKMAQVHADVPYA